MISVRSKFISLSAAAKTHSDTPAPPRAHQVSRHCAAEPKGAGAGDAPVDVEEVGKVAEALDEVLVEEQHAEAGVHGFKRPMRNRSEDQGKVVDHTWTRTTRLRPVRVK